MTFKEYYGGTGGIYDNSYINEVLAEVYCEKVVGLFDRLATCKNVEEFTTFLIHEVQPYANTENTQIHWLPFAYLISEIRNRNVEKTKEVHKILVDFYSEMFDYVNENVTGGYDVYPPIIRHNEEDKKEDGVSGIDIDNPLLPT